MAFPDGYIYPTTESILYILYFHPKVGYIHAEMAYIFLIFRSVTVLAQYRDIWKLGIVEESYQKPVFSYPVFAPCSLVHSNLTSDRVVVQTS